MLRCFQRTAWRYRDGSQTPCFKNDLRIILPRTRHNLTVKIKFIYCSAILIVINLFIKSNELALISYGLAIDKLLISY